MKLEIAEVFFIKMPWENRHIKAADAPMVGELMEKLDKEFIQSSEDRRSMRSSRLLSDHGLLEARLHFFRRYQL